MNAAVRIPSLAAQIDEAEHALKAAQDALAERRADAMAAALHARDAEYCVSAGILPKGEGAYQTALAADGAARSRLNVAHTVVVQATTARDQAIRQQAAAKTAAERARRRAWVFTNRPALAKRLEEAHLALATAKASTAPDARTQVRVAEQARVRTEEAIMSACFQAPPE